ncbi:MAG: hypothetical protein JO026_00755 [Patescibacteria group bacterium]|nr:hypothetical protein [Patescibacteria group bacterium]
MERKLPDVADFFRALNAENAEMSALWSRISWRIRGIVERRERKVVGLQGKVLIVSSPYRLTESEEKGIYADIMYACNEEGSTEDLRRFAEILEEVRYKESE